jgi:DeoR/GlpR family transcriptional regulator of sugar metabolism
MVRVAPVDRIARVITDNGVPAEDVQLLTDNGVKVEVV